jgi:type IV pilus assembly protein PilX
MTVRNRLRANGPATQRGAALIIGLILLLILTILAVSGVFTSTLELRMVGNQQQQERVFQVADIDIERAIASAPLSTSQPWDHCQEKGEALGDCDPTVITAGGVPMGQYEFTVEFDSGSSLPTVPTGYSLGSGFQAFHFVAQSTGSNDTGATSTHTQGFYIVGPGGGTTFTTD